VTIHSEHPFSDPEPDRDPSRRLRGRLGGAVTLWTTGSAEGGAAADRAGLTVSSVMVAHGDPAHVLGLLDPDSDLAAAVARTGTAVVNLLQWEHRDLADAFAGVAPAPGGPFRMGSWQDTDWGPVLAGVSGWAGVRLDTATPAQVGWSLLLDGVVEHVDLDEETAPLVHRRGRYVRPA
jgi:flavin reductase (DIM6/NTAB) family NADH-FMN oxidoreductase RutF